MLNKIKNFYNNLGKSDYEIETQDFFNPLTSDIVSLSDLEQIIKGEIINPKKLENPNSSTNYSFFIVNVEEELDINQGVLNITPNCSWIGHFCRNNTHEIAFFKEKPDELGIRLMDLYSFYFNKNLGYVRENYTDSLWSGNGNFDPDKHTKCVPLISKVSSNDLIDLIQKNKNIVNID